MDIDCLISILQAKYEIEVDWEGQCFCGISLKWDYEKGTVDLSVPGYIKAALHRFAHPLQTKPEHAPSKFT